MGSHLFKSLRLSVVLMLLCGLGYHLLVTGIAQALVPYQANGSLILNEQQQVIGSELIGQNFNDPGLFHGRISSIEHDGSGSGSNNYAPSNEDMMNRTKESIAKWQAENPDVPVSEVPMDLMTNSGSGLDPHISPEAAIAQIPRIEKNTGLDAATIQTLIEKNTQGKEWGIFGEPRVNVLKLNLDVLAELKKE
ncbi:potassium-transporting ATPase subunit KdpC [Ammoniphilus sp. CFH 90114]|uniref:potassium-transporting ATPase subunit KdpC n=1 Tax=Ammoniphilus sp. CFH 90114 TaxID=2493665 RepID=UPI00100E1640|nr:potassium-transporting ATPase subunit KdpC [Ammoniphilus sp. CFH 90114]RXT08938.1 potassium-transporting ATPase subunit KdpC [Ammoniphilus sp. CFH 90114]